MQAVVSREIRAHDFCVPIVLNLSQSLFSGWFSNDLFWPQGPKNRNPGPWEVTRGPRWCILTAPITPRKPAGAWTASANGYVGLWVWGGGGHGFYQLVKFKIILYLDLICTTSVFFQALFFYKKSTVLNAGKSISMPVVLYPPFSIVPSAFPLLRVSGPDGTPCLGNQGF